MTKKIKTIKRYLLSIPAYRGVYPERQHSKKKQSNSVHCCFTTYVGVI